jgi:O-antigen/teichoic acid export membrane protein
MVFPLFPFATSNAMGLVSSRVNVILLSMMSSLVSVGLYSAVSKLQEALQLIPSIIGQLMLPRISRSFATTKSYSVEGYHGYFAGLFALVMPLAVGFILFAQPLIELIYGPEFGGSAIILRILMVYLVLDCGEMIMGIILKASGHQKEDVRFYSANLIANVLLNIALIPSFGGVGSAAARIGGILCSFSLRSWFIGRRLARVGWRAFTAKPILASAVLALCTFPFLGRVHSGVLGGAYAFVFAIFLIRIAYQVIHWGSK